MADAIVAKHRFQPGNIVDACAMCGGSIANEVHKFTPVVESYRVEEMRKWLINWFNQNAAVAPNWYPQNPMLMVAFKLDDLAVALDKLLRDKGAIN